jgi:hypothetical protein
VVDIRRGGGTRSNLECAIVEWEHAGKAIRAELPDCDGGSNGPKVGTKIPIRYALSDLRTPIPDTWMDIYGSVIPLGILGALFTALFLFVVIPRRSKG